MGESGKLSDAVWAGDLTVVDSLIAAGADVNSADGDRDPPLGLAIEQQWIEIVHRLIAARAAINRDRGDGWTPLAHAIDIESDAASQQYGQSGHESTELTELLLKAGAIPTKRAFEVATAYGNERALVLLRRYATSARQEQ